MARNFQRYAASPMTRVLRLGHDSTHGGSVLALAAPLERSGSGDDQKLTEFPVSADVNIKTIEQIHQASSRGDHLDRRPWYGVRHGKDAVAAFFTAFGSAMEIEE
jgi:hypothetical protein